MTAHPFRFLFLLFLILVSAAPLFAGDPEDIARKASEMLKKGESDKALELLRDGVSRYPYETELRRGLTETYLATGQELLKKKRYEESAQRFAAGEEQFPDDPRFHFFRGISLYFANDLGQARAELDTARNLGASGPDLLFYLGKVSYAAGELTEAIGFWEEALALDPKNQAVAAALEKARREFGSEEKMGKGRSSRFALSFDSSVKPEIADRVLEVLEDAYNRVGGDLGIYPTGSVQVILYTESEFRTVTGSPDWSGGLYDGKIRLPVRGLRQITPAIRGVLFHEYTHVLIRELTRGNVPVWLNEGIAEVQGRREYDPPLKELEAAIRQKKLIPVQELEKSFPSGGKDVLLAYQQSYTLARHLVTGYGWNHVRDILDRLGNGTPARGAINDSLADVGLTCDAFLEEWRDRLQKEFSSR